MIRCSPIKTLTIGFLQRTLFEQEHRSGTAYAQLMRRVVAGLNSEQMRDVTRD